MKDLPAITLRYFDARGRAQYLRYYLRLRKVPFVDDRIPLDENFAAWQKIKHDRDLTGPFLKLPVLHWGDLLLAESQVIHDWLHRKLGDEASMNEQDNLRHAMLSSSCRSELMLPLGMLLWQEVMYPGADLAASAQSSFQRITAHLQILDATLQEWQWFEMLGQRPMMLADCLLWDSLNTSQTVLGSRLEWGATPHLHHFYQECQGASLFQQMLAEQPCQQSGRPQEAAALQRIHAVLSA